MCGSHQRQKIRSDATQTAVTAAAATAAAAAAAATTTTTIAITCIVTHICIWVCIAKDSQKISIRIALHSLQTHVHICKAHTLATKCFCKNGFDVFFAQDLLATADQKMNLLRELKGGA